MRRPATHEAFPLSSSRHPRIARAGRHVQKLCPPAGESLGACGPHFLAAAILLVAIAGVKAEGPTNPLDGERAFGYLEQICELGPRPSGTAAMREQRLLLATHFRDLGGNVREQSFYLRQHPLTGERVRLSNLIVEWHPEKQDRILLCAHYDTRPRPDNDPNPRLRETGRFVGANDGASGVAVLMELGHLMPALKTQYGVDFVLFDAEELVYGTGALQKGEYFVGSKYFAFQYRENQKQRRGPRYHWAVLLDMVGDKDLRLYQEAHSVRWADTRPLVNAIWSTAQRLGVQEFVPRRGFEIQDDHLPLHDIARIPACDLIDFEYPEYPDNVYWHSVEDTPDKCSAESLAKVGWVVYEWLRTTN